MIIVGGSIGLGKSTISEMLARHFNSEVFFESVDDNKVLPLFYTLSEEELLSQRVPFLLQLHFLDTRYRTIKKASKGINNVVDRSLKEDLYFCSKNKELGRINELEYELYCNLHYNMMEDAPGEEDAIIVYLTGSFETMINRIKLRGREYELDDSLIEYYNFIWKDYDEWFKANFDESKTVVINMDEIDVVNNPGDAAKVINMVEEKMRQVRKWTKE
ncbi:MAG: deoxynucleoside kinase [Bacilli bacterium]|uniref:deoxynucleoside kinase n=1 Tax=Clostridium sp. TaxID=1506 RepID=UPI002FCC7BC2